MTLYQITNFLKEIALSSPYIRTAAEGSVYTILNGNPHSKYGVFVISQTLHRQDDIWDYYGFNMFVIDRLVDDLETNRLQIQSVAKEVLANTILTFITRFYGVTHNELQFHPFTEKFVDLCAGQYVQVTFQVPKSLICPDEYALDYKPEYTLQPLVVEITENGVFEYEPTGFDGYNKVTVTVNVDIPDNFEEGFESGVTYQKSLLSAITIYENGEYITDENGVSAITVDVSGYTQDDLDNAYQSGITYQKSLLSAITIDHNGEFINENGYSAITVNVPQSGETVNNQSKIITISGNGSYTITYDEGYTGLEDVIINVNVSGDTPTPPTPSGDTKYRDMYLTTAALENGTITVTGIDRYAALDYRINGGEWITAQSAPVTINVNTGDRVEYRMTKASFAHLYFLGIETKFRVYGNIMSIMWGDDFKDKTEFNSHYNKECEYMFSGCTGLIDAGDLVLPALSLHQDSYFGMFQTCPNLTKAPKLYATSLGNQCYGQMFAGCTSLETAPEIGNPSFGNPNQQFVNMFTNCSSLNYIKCLETNTSDTLHTFMQWVDGVAPTGIFIKAQGVNWPTGNNGIPTGWTVIEE